MSKTLEELGYENFGEDEYAAEYFNKKTDAQIIFSKSSKNVAIKDGYDENYQCITMEELKAIYKWCEDNKWIEDETSKLKQELKEKEEIIKDMQDELKHMPSIVSETM